MYNDTIHNILVLLNSIAKIENTTSEQQLFHKRGHALSSIRRIINSVNKNQVASKTWLAEELWNICPIENPSVCIAAGWYGLMAHLIREKTDNDIVSFDIDDQCKKIGRQIFSESNIDFRTKDMQEFNPQTLKKFDIIICTSCEHITDLMLWKFLENRKKNCLVALQSNNFDSPNQDDGHINIKQSLKQFENDVGLQKILYSETRPMHPDWERYLVIGI